MVGLEDVWGGLKVRKCDDKMGLKSWRFVGQRCVASGRSDGCFDEKFHVLFRIYQVRIGLDC